MRERLHSIKTITPKTFALLGLFALASLSTLAQAPGGVTTNLKLWLKANAGTGTTTDGADVTSWVDNLTSPTIVTSSGPVNPTYIANGTNYNPGIFYPQGAYHAFTGTTSILNSIVVLAGTPITASSVDAVHNPFVSDDGFDFPLNLSSGMVGYNNSTTSDYPLPWVDGEFAFVKQRILTGGDIEIAKGGGPEQPPGITTGAGSGTYAFIGGNPTAQRSFGNISEVIIFDDADALSDDERRKIDSYFFMKYGIVNQDPDATNFLLSNGTQVWGNDFTHNILTIVKDDASALLQKQSHSANDDTRLYVGTLASTNSANSGTISTNLSAIVMADDNASIAMTTELPVIMPILSRFQRTWQIQNTNFTDNFSIEIAWDSAHYFDMSAFQLLVSSTDPGLSDAAPVAATFTSTPNSIIISGLNPADFLSGTQFYFSVGSTTLATLPVAMTFSAAVTPDSKVALNWQTTSEINNNYFTVERSVDAQSWEAVTKVNGAGTTTSVKNYSFVDKDPYTGVSYYRLKQTDLDGKYSYSKVKTVKIDKNRNSILTIYPNPVSGTLYIKAAATELATLRIFNMTGIDVTTLVRTIETTTSGRVLDLSRLPNGNYNIKTTTAVTKVIKN